MPAFGIACASEKNNTNWCIPLIIYCIRTLGLIPSKVPKRDDGTAKRVSIEYTLTAARVFQEVCQKPFRFVYVSGAGTERDQSKSLWIMQDYRRIRVSIGLFFLDCMLEILVY